MRFSDTVVAITGGGSGIGEAVAHRIAKEGADVLIVGRTQSKLETVAKQINEEVNRNAVQYFVADVTNEERITELATFVQKNYGHLDVLINNAGGSPVSRLFNTSAEDWDFVQETNLKSVFLVSKYLGQLMAESSEKDEGKRKDRTIVNVASLSGHKAAPTLPHYSAAKAAVVNLSKTLAHELSQFGIRVNSVSPGFIKTPMTEISLESERFMKTIERSTAMGRVGEAEEIANVIAFMASSEASYMTGSDIVVDGGWLIS
ncbi:SDR family oxidoreductase [Cytobacillus sp. IB215665]|uniref:SDR family NAD(P)-dependent oxidoreductase n=1 Tax=Cytobacillus sp. IB215665 TaxID=3097357 RepID=UPI002A0F7CD4|nr:SDR family oxidoreductase [Cytobacillus sp. IB215665]MDX8366205.1 SDR family oxidoreductase [Cytobacillus sp. IB215665]